MIGGGEVRGMSFGMDSAFGISVLLDDDDDDVHLVTHRCTIIHACRSNTEYAGIRD